MKGQSELNGAEISGIIITSNFSPDSGLGEEDWAKGAVTLFHLTESDVFTTLVQEKFAKLEDSTTCNL